MLFVFIYTERQIGVKELPRNPQLANNRPRHIPGASLLAQRLKRLPAMWETQVRSLGREDPLEKEMVNEHELGQTPGDGEGQGGLVCCSPWGRKKSDNTE